MERSACRPGEEPTLPSTLPIVRTEGNISYAPWIHKSIKLDILPARGKETDLCVLMVHGGGWDKGDKDVWRPEMSFMAARGFHSAAINYRLSDDAIFPAPWVDVCLAVQYLRGRGLRVILMGHSAGGHLVSMAGLAYPGREDVAEDARVEAVISISGVHDLRYETMKSLGFPFRYHCEKLLGGKYEEPDVQERAAMASPVLYVDAAGRRWDDPPEFLVIHGSKDPGVPVRQAHLLIEKMQSVGYPVTPVILEGAGHYVHIENREPTLAAIGRFVDKIAAKPTRVVGKAADRVAEHSVGAGRLETSEHRRPAGAGEKGA